MSSSDTLSCGGLRISFMVSSLASWSSSPCFLAGAAFASPLGSRGIFILPQAGLDGTKDRDRDPGAIAAFFVQNGSTRLRARYSREQSSSP